MNAFNPGLAVVAGVGPGLGASLARKCAKEGCQLAALLILRIASALAFLEHGSAILFGAFGGPGPQGFAAQVHMPAVVGYLVGLAQVAGGLAILSGALVRLGAACIIVVIVAKDIVFWCPFGNYLAELLREQNALWFLARDSDFVMTLAFSCLGVKREASAEPQSKS
jgi:uncharacterized membrane protein YphA (DoxX/SURF4 family)